MNQYRCEHCTAHFENPKSVAWDCSVPGKYTWQGLDHVCPTCDSKKIRILLGPCNQCSSGAEAISSWGMGAVRCQPCTDQWTAKVRAKRMREWEDERERYKIHTYKRDLDGHCPDDGEVCSECCEHEFDWDEGYTCLNCGKEGMEDAMCAAYDRWKDSRYE